MSRPMNTTGWCDKCKENLAFIERCPDSLDLHGYFATMESIKNCLCNTNKHGFHYSRDAPYQEIINA